MTEANELNFERPQRKSEKRAAAGKTGKRKPPLKERIPQLPPLDVDPAKLHAPGQRGLAAVNMRLAGAPFVDIARELGYSDATSAKTAYISALSHLFPQEDLETIRQAEAMRAEQLLRRSLAMAGADYLVDMETGQKIPNPDRLRWHEQAGKDLALHAAITGAKAPARVEVSATTQELNQIVAIILQQSGQSEIEADVFDVEELDQGELEQLGDLT